MSEDPQPTHMPVRKLDRDAVTWELLTPEEMAPARFNGGLVYRFYDIDRAPLYIGSTGNSVLRLVNHRTGSSWWPLAEYVAVSHYPSYEDGRRAEAAAIRRERPRFNRVGMEWRKQTIIRLDEPATVAAEELHRIARPEYLAELAGLLANPAAFTSILGPPNPWPSLTS